jgi:DNA invertase Pin-like site-specific DNA recombinase
MDTAFSYVRFSHPEQAKGDSVKRQTEAAETWCTKHGVALDKTITLHDLGKSAFTGEHRKNADRHALAAFLRLVEQGKVPRGSYLIVEALDRLTREDLQPALLLVLNLLQSGVRVVTLKPNEMVLDERSDTMPVMMCVLELARGHSESAVKSERIGSAWRAKKRRGRENGEIITRRLPAWIQEHGGKLHLIPERAAVVRRIFELSLNGHGVSLIVRKFVTEGVKAFGERQVNAGRKRSQFCGQWTRSYVGNILKDRRALGEFQPCRSDGKPDGPPIKDYFPAVVDESTWLAARAGAEQRRRKPGRVGSYVNVFAGLLKDARGSGSYYCASRGPRKGAYQRVLLNTNASEARECLFSFPFASFESGILSLLREIDPRDVLQGSNGHDDLMTLEGELGQVESAIVSLVADLDAHGESPALYARLRAKETRKAELVEQLAVARQKAANPLSAGWVETQSILAVLDSARNPLESRLRLRAALRRIVESIYLLIVPRGRMRLAAVRIDFNGGSHRDYLILHRAAKPGGQPSWEARSAHWQADGKTKGRGFDLRNKKDATELEGVLLESLE